MIQIKTFRNEDLKRLEDEVNLWLQSQADKISVLQVSSGTSVQYEKDKKKTYNTTTVSFEVKEKSRILHG